ncbi:hypothetical protein M885DRAFT_516467, partial [Pelagophyceae sp. CCMP2097]
MRVLADATPVEGRLGDEPRDGVGPMVLRRGDGFGLAARGGASFARAGDADLDGGLAESSDSRAGDGRRTGDGARAGDAARRAGDGARCAAAAAARAGASRSRGADSGRRAGCGESPVARRDAGARAPLFSDDVVDAASSSRARFALALRGRSAGRSSRDEAAAGIEPLRAGLSERVGVRGILLLLPKAAAVIGLMLLGPGDDARAAGVLAGVLAAGRVRKLESSEPASLAASSWDLRAGVDRAAVAGDAERARIELEVSFAGEKKKADRSVCRLRGRCGPSTARRCCGRRARRRRRRRLRGSPRPARRPSGSGAGPWTGLGSATARWSARCSGWR